MEQTLHRQPCHTVRDEDLQQSFGQFGAVTSAKVMMECDTGRSKGLGFFEMGSDADAQAVIDGMNGQSLDGRSITANEALRVPAASAVVVATAIEPCDLGHRQGCG